MKKRILFVISLIFYIGIIISCLNKTAANTLSENEEFINLYFSDSNVEYLVEEKRSIEDVTPQKAVQALIEGPKSKELKSLLPEELEVVDIVVKDGVAYVNIHESVPFSKHGNYGSSTVTRHIINSITATLILNETFGIEKVKLEGDIGDILYGIDTSTFLEVNLDLIKENK